jgi:hypothetical protein
MVAVHILFFSVQYGGNNQWLDGSLTFTLTWMPAVLQNLPAYTQIRAFGHIPHRSSSRHINFTLLYS